MVHFKTAIVEVLTSFKNVGLVFTSLKDFLSRGDAMFGVFRVKEPYIDMRGSELEIKTSLGLSLWKEVVFGIPALLISILTSIFVLPSVVGIILSILGTAFSWAVSLAITAALVMLVSYYSGAWSAVVAKIFAVLVIIGIVGGAIGVVGSIIGVIMSLVGMTASFTSGLLGIISGCFEIIGGIVGIAIDIMALNGLNKGVGYNR